MAHQVSTVERARAVLDASWHELVPRMQRLSHEIHRDPELGCREVRAVSRIAGELEEEGFAVATGVGGLATALHASIGNGNGPTIAFLMEYDAIPDLGHASGHNLTVAASYGAAVATARALEHLHGKVVVIGAPAEETIGGKIVLLEAGVFDGIDAALMVHPAAEEAAAVTSLASWSVDVTFEGRSSHAVLAPERGVNALDAAIQLFTARDALMKSLRPEVRIPGVILEGGVRPNLVPRRARARFSLRAHDRGYLVDTVLARFREAVQGVALATGTRATVSSIDNLYDEFLANAPLADMYGEALTAHGGSASACSSRPFGSLDVGALSHRVPALHPLFRIGGDEEITTHSRAFAAAAASLDAFRGACRASRALGAVALELIAEPSKLDAIGAQHAELSRGWSRLDDATLIKEPVDP